MTLGPWPGSTHRSKLIATSCAFDKVFPDPINFFRRDSGTIEDNIFAWIGKEHPVKSELESAVSTAERLMSLSSRISNRGSRVGTDASCKSFHAVPSPLPRTKTFARSIPALGRLHIIIIIIIINSLERGSFLC